MLLRRIMQHLRKQEWTVVALDLLIVVVGVFIGIQASNWNDAREAAVEERQLISRLSTEFETGLALARETENETYQYAVGLDALLTKLDSGEPISQADACELIAGAVVFRFGVTPPPSYSQMLSTGGISLLRDANLREALREYDREVRIATSAADKIYASMIPHLTVVQTYIRYERAPQPGSIDFRPRVRSVDIEGLRNDRRAIAGLERIYVTQTNQQALAHRTTESMEAVVAALDQAEQ
ncbi:MAG: hypothetical protein KF779_10810 [Hyphomonadaceae bacterium]|nr:hypothetical protein [Hyphomonadaceae bacterium]